jgi:hypothetical protein
MVDKARFELAASSLRTKRSTELIYLPKNKVEIPAKHIKVYTEKNSAASGRNKTALPMIISLSAEAYSPHTDIKKITSE